MSEVSDLYQQVILEHNKKPRNFRRLEPHTHMAEGYNPLCGDHLHVYLDVDAGGLIREASFEGSGCAISKASASLMTMAVKGLSVDKAQKLIAEFHGLLTKKLDPDQDAHELGKLKIFSGIWQYPARVKCAALAWHALRGAIEQKQTVSTE